MGARYFDTREELTREVCSVMDQYSSDVKRLVRDYENSLEDLKAKSPTIEGIKNGRDEHFFDVAYDVIFKNKQIVSSM